jgi:5-bromo-4-chloroindolyl phosphate hydrolysis protein
MDLYEVVSIVGLAGLVGVGAWVGMMQTKVNHHDVNLTRHEADMSSFRLELRETREDVIRIRTILEQSKIGEMNDRLVRVEAVVRQIAKKDGIEF